MAAPEEVKQMTKTFKETNYFAVGTYKRDFVELMSSGLLANFITTTILGPLQRWKIIKQTQMTYDYRPKDKFPSFVHFISKATSQQGFTSLWRGNVAHLWLQGWQAAMQIFLFDTIKATFSELSFEMQNEPISKFLLERLAAPLVASATSLAITHPIDTARIRMAMNYHRNPSEMHFHGILTCWGMIKLQNGGSNRVLYRGYLLANLISLLHLNIYATVRDLWSRNKVDMGEYGDLFASKEFVGMLASLMLLHPLDTIKKNLQLNNMDKNDRSMRNNNARKVFRQFSERHGFPRLYQGMFVTVARQMLFCPLFMLMLGPIEQNIKLF